MMVWNGIFISIMRIFVSSIWFLDLSVPFLDQPSPIETCLLEFPDFQWHGDVFIGTTTHPAVTTSIISFLGSGIPTQTFICDCYWRVDRKYSFSRLKTWHNSPMMSHGSYGFDMAVFPMEKNSHKSTYIALEQVYGLFKVPWCILTPSK